MALTRYHFRSPIALSANEQASPDSKDHTNLDNPLSIGLTQSSSRAFTAEGVGGALARSQVLDLGGA